jgi:hypothetical protein
MWITKWFANNNAQLDRIKASRDTEKYKGTTAKTDDCAKTGRETY